MPAQRRIYRLESPSFGLKWAKAQAPEAMDTLIIAGGGGGVKSGVKNTIMLSSFEALKSPVETAILKYSTEQELCVGFAVAPTQHLSLFCALLGKSCCILGYSYNAEDVTQSIKELARFDADFADVESGVNACCFIGENAIATGGEDGVVRVWNFAEFDPKLLSSQNDKVTLVKELTGHTKSIMSLSEHPYHPWVCSGSRDGTCKIWDIVQGREIACLQIPSDTQQYMCRGCTFSTAGAHLFVLFTPKKGSSLVIKYGLQADADTNLSCESLASVVVSKVPATQLGISHDGSFVAVGTSAGEVVLLAQSNLRRQFTEQVHDLPVTGIAFPPSKEEVKFVVSCSADYSLAVIPVERGTWAFGSAVKHLFILLLLLFFLCFAWLLYAYVYDDGPSPVN